MAQVYDPLISNVTDGFKIVDVKQDLLNMHYECENYKSVYDPMNNAKLDFIIGKELGEGYLKVVTKKPICIHSMGAVPKPDGGWGGGGWSTYHRLQSAKEHFCQ